MTLFSTSGQEHNTPFCLLVTVSYFGLLFSVFELVGSIHTLMDEGWMDGYVQTSFEPVTICLSMIISLAYLYTQTRIS